MNPIPPIKPLPAGRAERRIDERWSGLKNLAMAEKLSSHETLSVLDEGIAIGGGLYVLKRFVEDRDYCDPVSEAFIWSIGRSVKTGEIVASTRSDLYLNPDYECLFLR